MGASILCASSSKRGELTIVDLNGIFRMFFPKIRPRLQKCPALLKSRVPQVL